MEQEFEQEVHPDYLKGFNEGYLLRQHNPELADSLARSFKDISSERASGFIAGGKEYDKEREQVLSISWMKPLPGEDTPQQEKNMGKDDPDLGIEKN